MRIVIKREELLNYSMEKLKDLIKPNVVIRYSHSVALKGNEIVDFAPGGEVVKNGAGLYKIGGKQKPAGIRFPYDMFVNIQNIEEIIIDE